VLYSLDKFVRLLLKQNPNSLLMLYLDEEDYLSVSPVGRALLERRELFRSSELAGHAFLGYAHGQLSKARRPDRNGHMGAKRRALVERYGYDTKNASHCARLLNQGIEYLTTGAMQVKRTHDRDLLLSIKRGEKSWQWINAYAEEKTGELREALLVRDVMPERIDDGKVDGLLQKLTLQALDW